MVNDLYNISSLGIIIYIGMYVITLIFVTPILDNHFHNSIVPEVIICKLTQRNKMYINCHIAIQSVVWAM